MRIIEEKKRSLRHSERFNKTREPIKYENDLPLLPRIYLYFPQPDIIGIKQFMLMEKKDFDNRVQMVPTLYQVELKHMCEEYYSTRPSKRDALMNFFVQRNEELGRELGRL